MRLARFSADSLSICLLARLYRRVQLLALPVDVDTAPLDDTARGVTQLLTPLAKVIAAFERFAAEPSAGIRARARGEHHSQRDSDAESEKEVRQTLAFVHVYLLRCKRIYANFRIPVTMES
jgi:hypothetical protein